MPELGDEPGDEPLRGGSNSEGSRARRSRRGRDPGLRSVASATRSGEITSRRESRPARRRVCGNPSVSTGPGFTLSTRIPWGASSAATFRENASCACLAAVYGPYERHRNRPGHGGYVHDRSRATPLEERHERPDAPHARQVVRVGDGLDPLGLELQECAPGGNPGAVDQEPDCLVSLADPPGEIVDLRPVRDVARLELAVDLRRDAPLAAPGRGRRERIATLARPGAARGRRRCRSIHP